MKVRDLEKSLSKLSQESLQEIWDLTTRFQDSQMALYYLDHPWEWIRDNVKTFDRDGTILEFPDWKYLEEMVLDLHHNRLNIWHKSRQMMATWVVAAYALYLITFHPRIQVTAISRNLEQVLDVQNRIDFMHRNLPEQWRKPKRSDAQTKFDVKHGVDVSEIKFSAAGKSAGRGPQTAFFILDEFAFMQHAPSIFIGIKPSIDGNGRGVVLSTGNGKTRRNKFYCLVEDADELGFHYKQIHYRLNPLKDEAWQEEARKGLSQAEWDQEHECKWIGLAGLVYPQFDRGLHLRPAPQYDDGDRFYCSVDYGYTNPFAAALYVSPGPDHWQLRVAREYYVRETLTRDHADALVRMLCLPRFINGEWVEDPPPVRVEFANGLISDPAAKQQRKDLEAELERAVREYWESKSEEWRKLWPRRPRFHTKAGKTDIMAGINAVATKLETLRGDEPALVIDTVDGKPVASSMVFELENYAWPANNGEGGQSDKTPRNDDERPVKMNDHQMDQLKNLLLTMKAGSAKGHAKKPKGW